MWDKQFEIKLFHPKKSKKKSNFILDVPSTFLYFLFIIARDFRDLETKKMRYNQGWCYTDEFGD